MQTWLADSYTRHFPGTHACERPTLELHAARGGRCSFQAAFRTDETDLEVTLETTADPRLNVTVRRVGYVPMPHMNTQTPRDEIDGFEHLPGLAPDPLFPEAVIHAGPYETNAFWITADPEPGIDPGTFPVELKVAAAAAGQTVLTALVTVHRAVQPVRRNFPVTHWFYADALLDWYRLRPFEQRFWTILDAYLADVAAHGQDTIYVPAFTPPLDGVKRPSQLLHVRREGDRFSFDWTEVRRWIDCARAHGIRHFEWVHLFTQWGAGYAIRVYEGHDGELLWPADTGAVSTAYRNFLSQYLPELKTFLDAEGLLESSFFHVSDEPHGDAHLANYRAARDMLRELAPWMTVIDALSELEYARQNLTDMPVPSIRAAPEFVAEGIPCWTYFCCGPRGRHLNRLLDTPLAKMRMAGWLFYRLGARGFLHWGYNYWTRCQTRELIDPYTVTDGLNWPGWPYGDPMMVYPGAEGPVDSLRWEVFAESLQDYALLQACNVDPADEMLDGIGDYADFPRDKAWIEQRRKQLLEKLDG